MLKIQITGRQAEVLAMRGRIVEGVKAEGQSVLRGRTDGWSSVFEGVDGRTGRDFARSYRVSSASEQLAGILLADVLLTETVVR